MFGVRCGEALGLGAGTCAACGADAVGASFDEDGHLGPDRRARVPPLCCRGVLPGSGVSSQQSFGG